MLTEESYHLAWLVYGGTTLVGLLMLNHWMRGRASATVRRMLLLPLGGMALVPAHPDIASGTFAPAAVVAVFSYLTDGPGASMPALRVLIGGLLLGVVLALLPPLPLRGSPERAQDRGRADPETMNNHEGKDHEV